MIGIGQLYRPAFCSLPMASLNPASEKIDMRGASKNGRTFGRPFAWT
jgi:hypothetical protein